MNALLETKYRPILANDSNPNFPSVLRSEDPVTQPQFQSIKMITPGSPNADDQVNEFAKAMRLINDATYSLSDLQRAHRTDLVTPALLKLVQRPDLAKLQGRSWEAKEMRELELQIDADNDRVL